ncbi:MAG: hypothetical protein FWG12_07110 [Holophagaceae bacterium]|nr:hypothetical protein [Holophagaceae bacterium]
MQVSAVDFIKTPEFYLGKVDAENVHITKNGHTIAVLAKPSETPVSDSLLGILKDSGIKDASDIKAMKVGV